MGNPKIQTGNLLENLNEAPTSLLVEAEEENIPEIKDMLTHFMQRISNIAVGVPFPSHRNCETRNQQSTWN